MRPIQKGELENMRNSFEDTTGSLATFSAILEYGYNDRNNNLVVGATWEEAGFYGLWTPGVVEINEKGETQAVLATGPRFIDTTDISATLKIPAHLFKDGFEMLNPARPTQVAGAKAYIKDDDAAAVNYNGRIRVCGIILNTLYGDKPRIMADAQYEILEQPVETVDGALVYLKASVLPAFYTKTDYTKYNTGMSIYAVRGLPSGWFERYF